MRCMAVQAGLIETEDIIIDAKSGVSGAGRSAKQNLLYTEIAEGINCYGVGSHRHMPEIEQARRWVLFFFWRTLYDWMAPLVVQAAGLFTPVRMCLGVMMECCTYSPDSDKKFMFS